MKITDDKTLHEMQDEFRSEFPFLKLEFFSHPQGVAKESASRYRLKPHLITGQVRTTHNCGYINLDPNLTTGALEQTFQNIFGLNIQVYRRSFGNWVQTWSSDTWTLKEQNLRSMLTEDKAVII